MPADTKRATEVVATLRAFTRRLVGNAPAWSTYEQAIDLLAGDLAAAVDDRPNACRHCGAPRDPRLAPPLAELAELLRHPPGLDEPPSTERGRALRFGHLMYLIGVADGMCAQHGDQFAFLAAKARN